MLTNHILTFWGIEMLSKTYTIISLSLLLLCNSSLLSKKFKIPAPYKGTQQGVELSLEAIDKNEAARCLGYSVRNRIQTLKLKLVNLSNNRYRIKQSDIHLPLLSSSKVASIFSTGTTASATISLPFAFVSACTIIAFATGLIPGLLLVIPFVGFSAYTIQNETARQNSNADIDKILECRTFNFGESIELAPGKDIERYLFVSRRDFKNEFDMEIFNVDTKEYASFKVAMK